MLRSAGAPIYAARARVVAVDRRWGSGHDHGSSLAKNVSFCLTYRAPPRRSGPRANCVSPRRTGTRRPATTTTRAGRDGNGMESVGNDAAEHAFMCLWRPETRRFGQLITGRKVGADWFVQYAGDRAVTFVLLNSVFFFTPNQHQSSASNQPIIFFSYNKLAPAISHSQLNCQLIE